MGGLEKKEQKQRDKWEEVMGGQGGTGEWALEITVHILETVIGEQDPLL
jgi:hypothetical protein